MDFTLFIFIKRNRPLAPALPPCRLCRIKMRSYSCSRLKLHGMIYLFDPESIKLKTKLRKWKPQICSLVLLPVSQLLHPLIHKPLLTSYNFNVLAIKSEHDSFLPTGSRPQLHLTEGHIHFQGWIHSFLDTTVKDVFSALGLLKTQLVHSCASLTNVSFLHSQTLILQLILQWDQHGMPLFQDLLLNTLIHTADSKLNQLSEYSLLLIPLEELLHVLDRALRFHTDVRNNVNDRIYLPRKCLYTIYVLLLLLLLCWGLNSGPTPWATPPALFGDGFFSR
jgi:hypothetical protein